jgi:predicted enzyme related to lactoylglutathione lyase
MPAPVVFFDIAGPDDEALRHFYDGVFGWQADGFGQFAVPASTSLRGAFRKDPADKRIYIGVPDVTASLAAVAQHGGMIEVPRFEVPGVVVLGLFRDPAGNTMGLVELDGDVPRVP